MIALLGERGREVREFIEGSLGPEGLARSVVVVATGDEAALVRARGALVATAIAEYFRDRGQHVLLMVDSITRVAMAWREIGLAVGEPPDHQGLSALRLRPRCRACWSAPATRERGGITGIYTVLVEGDDFNEPVADAARSILDGHLVLTRKLAAAGHYPALDVLESKSRLRDQLLDPAQRQSAQAFQRTEAVYREQEDLVLVGAYQKGSSPQVDLALQHRAEMLDFLRQPPTEHSPFALTRERLVTLGARLKPPTPEKEA